MNVFERGMMQERPASGAAQRRLDILIVRHFQMSGGHMRRLMSFALVALTLVALAACLNIKIIKPPPCDPASTCVSVQEIRLDSCPYGPSDLNRRLFYQLFNDHPSKAIWVSYEVREDAVNAPGLPSRINYGTRKVVAKKSFPLACQYFTVNPSIWYRRSYRILSACFDDAEDCDDDQPIAVGPAAAACSDSCVGPDCLRRTLPSNVPLEDQALRLAGVTVRKVLSTTPPMQFDLNQLLGVGKICDARTPALIDQSGAFLSTGATCRMFMTVFGHPEVDYVGIAIGSSVGGTFSGDAKRKRIELRRDAPDVLLQWFTSDNKSLGTERLARVDLLPNQIRLSGDRRFCLWLDLGVDRRGK